MCNFFFNFNFNFLFLFFFFLWGGDWKKLSEAFGFMNDSSRDARANRYAVKRTEASKSSSRWKTSRSSRDDDKGDDHRRGERRGHHESRRDSGRRRSPHHSRRHRDRTPSVSSSSDGESENELGGRKSRKHFRVDKEDEQRELERSQRAEVSQGTGQGNVPLTGYPPYYPTGDPSMPPHFMPFDPTAYGSYPPNAYPIYTGEGPGVMPNYYPPAPAPAGPPASSAPPSDDPVAMEIADAIRRVRIDYLKAMHNPDMEELQRLLEETKAFQAQKQKASASEPTVAMPSSAASLPAPEDFVPVIPSFLLPALQKQGEETDQKAEGAAGEGTNASASAGPTLNALMTLEAPKIAPEVERHAREARRAHISGFPPSTTQQELIDFFRALLPVIRRERTKREMEEIANALNIPQNERNEFPSNAQTTNVDVIRDLSISVAKTKKFAFIELNLADSITELVERSEQNDPILHFKAQDGHMYPLTLRRPRDYDILEGVDECKVVLTGFPPTIPEISLKEVFEDYGDVRNFQVKDELAYAEFPNKLEALQCREGLHGRILANRMICAFPLYDWLKVLCHQNNIDVTIEEGDPISGRALIETITAEAKKDRLEQREAITEGSLALLKDTQTDAQSLMLSLLNMKENLHTCILRLAAVYPHLRPLYGNTQVVVYPTRVLALVNLFDEEELTADETYASLKREIEKEVEKYGRVEELIVPRRLPPPKRPAQPDVSLLDTPEEKEEAMREYEEQKEQFKIEVGLYNLQAQDPIKSGYGNAYVVYHTLEEAQEAQIQLAGKLFSGRTVITSFLYEDWLLEPERCTPASGGPNHSAADNQEDAPMEEGSEKIEEVAVDLD